MSCTGCTFLSGPCPGERKVRTTAPHLAWWSQGSPASWPPQWSCPPGGDNLCESEWCHPRASSWSPRALKGNSRAEHSASSRCAESIFSPLISFWRHKTRNPVIQPRTLEWDVHLLLEVLPSDKIPRLSQPQFLNLGMTSSLSQDWGNHETRKRKLTKERAWHWEDLQIYSFFVGY